MNRKIVMCLLICASMKHALGDRSLRDILFPGGASHNMEMARLEEGPGYSTYGHEQMTVARQRGIVPLVDTIREQDKYGNDGGHEPSNNTANLIAGLSPQLEELGEKLAGLA